MNNLLNASYWLDMRPGPLHFSGVLFFLFLILSFIVIIFLFSIARKRKNNVYFRIWNNLNTFAITNLVIALFLIFLEYEETYMLSSRSLLLLWGTSLVVWLFFILQNFRKIPKIKEEFAKKEEFNKYIP